MNLNKLSNEIYEANKLKGFDVAKENIGQTLMLVVSELSEALEAVRKKRAPIEWQEFNAAKISHYTDSEEFKTLFEKHIKDTFEDEIADAFIRLFDLCGAFNIDIASHIELKRKYNSLREYKHGKKF